MAWNEPGGSKDNDPWGRPKSGEQGPPDLDEVVRKIQDKFSGMFGGKSGRGGGDGGGGRSAGPSGGGKALWLVVLLVGAVLYGSACFYVVEPAERAVVLRFGQLVRTSMPGPGWAWFPVETVIKENVDEIRTVEIGYRVGGRGQQGITSVPKEALMLTRDENIVDIKFAVQYKIKDLASYLFKVVDPEESLRQATESAIREAVGQSNMDFVLTEGRSDIANRVQAMTQEILDRYGTGLQITSDTMQSAQAPEEVQDAFDDAVKAREDQQRLINEAEAYSNDVIPKARGQAARQIEESNGYKQKVMAQAEGEASRFSQILAEYRKAPEVTRQRMYMETIEQVLAKNGKVLVDVPGSNNVLMIPAAKPADITAADAASLAPVVIPGVTDAGAGAGGTDSDKQTDRGIKRDASRSRERR